MLLRQATGLESELVLAYLFDTEAIPDPHASDNRKSEKKVGSQIERKVLIATSIGL